jgi:aminopeptidase N
LLRDFSAPVKLSFGYTDKQLAFLAANDVNGFNRWDSLQQLYIRAILGLADDHRAGRNLTAPAVLVEAVANVAGDTTLSQAIRASMLTLPGYAILKDAVDVVYIDDLIAARTFLVDTLATKYRDIWRSLTEKLSSDKAYAFNAEESGRRQLQGLSLWYWLKAGDQAAFDFAENLYGHATNQTDRGNALRAVLAGDAKTIQQSLLSDFYDQW